LFLRANDNKKQLHKSVYTISPLETLRRNDSIRLIFRLETLRRNGTAWYPKSGKLPPEWRLTKPGLPHFVIINPIKI
jgi:hypothetical protein